MSSSSSLPWTVEGFCSSSSIDDAAASDHRRHHLSESSQAFLKSLDLSAVHPFCGADAPRPYNIPGVPPQGPLMHHDHLETWWDVIVTFFGIGLPSALAMMELWIRLFASLIAPAGIAHLLYNEIINIMSSTSTDHKNNKNTRGSSSHNNNGSSNNDNDNLHYPLTKDGVGGGGGESSVEISTAVVCLLTVASSVVLFTDTLYVLAYGARYGATVLALSSILVVRRCFRSRFCGSTSNNSASSSSSSIPTRITLVGTVGLLLLALFLSFHNLGDDRHGLSLSAATDQRVVAIEEGTYYDPSNSDIVQLVEQHWPVSMRTYNSTYGATPWMPTGDSRTGLPFLLHKGFTPRAKWTRLWLPVDDGEEAVALDIAFPPKTASVGGHDPSKPLYLLLHGLNGGSQEEFINDFADRRTSEGSTVVVMVARGLMDLPVRGMNTFHGARVSDVAAAAKTLRRALGKGQILAGVGYSMGAIILSNYVVRSGKDCDLDAAVAISGALDMRYQEHFDRAKRLWQPLITGELRDTMMIGKFGEKFRSRLSKDDMKRLMRATDVTGVDEAGVIVYNDFDSVKHYYSEMGALGDTVFENHSAMEESPNTVVGRIQDLAIPLCVIHALDDPLLTWRTVAANKGFMHPANLTRTGSGNLVLLLTKGGGHVGWPLGWFPHLHRWRWMNDAASSFVNATIQTKFTNVGRSRSQDE